MDDIKEALHGLRGLSSCLKICQMKNQLKNYTNQLLKNLRNVSCIHKTNICGADVAAMQLISKCNK